MKKIFLSIDIIIGKKIITRMRKGIIYINLKKKKSQMKIIILKKKKNISIRI